jgi:hypothetical protein
VNPHACESYLKIIFVRLNFFTEEVSFTNNLFIYPRCGFRLPGWRVRDIVDRMDRGHEGLSIEEFEKVLIYKACNF